MIYNHTFIVQIRSHSIIIMAPNRIVIKKNAPRNKRALAAHHRAHKCAGQQAEHERVGRIWGPRLAELEAREVEASRVLDSVRTREQAVERREDRQRRQRRDDDERRRDVEEEARKVAKATAHDQTVKASILDTVEQREKAVRKRELAAVARDAAHIAEVEKLVKRQRLLSRFSKQLELREEAVAARVQAAGGDAP